MPDNEQKTRLVFNDAVQWDGCEKTAISVRDGVLEYYGAEIGKEPANKLFTVYRSPATIANVAAQMVGIPLLDGHVTPGDEPSAEKCGTVLSGDMIDMRDPAVNSTLAIRNKVDVTDAMAKTLASGKDDASLGYTGELIEHNEYDFEQRDITPLHLAVVEAGRCGAACSFIDKKPEIEMAEKNPFLDAEGMPSLEQIAQLGSQLTEAIKTLPLDEFKKAWPTLKKIVEASAEADPASVKESVEGATEGEESEVVAEDMEGEEQKAEDAEAEKEEEKEKTPVTDSAAFKDALASAVAAETSIYAEAVEKARDFVDASYVFAGKDTATIQRDALKAEHGGQKFSDAELPVAFKMLKKTQSTLKDFGDQSSGSRFTDLKDKEL